MGDVELFEQKQDPLDITHSCKCNLSNIAVFNRHFEWIGISMVLRLEFMMSVISHYICKS